MTPIQATPEFRHIEAKLSQYRHEADTARLLGAAPWRRRAATLLRAMAQWLEPDPLTPRAPSRAH